MSQISYLDFDLLIERSETGYTARALDSPAGRATADFQIPFSEQELEIFVLRVGRTQHGVRRLESPEMETVKTLGAQLFDAVFQGEMRGCLRSSLDEAQRKGAGLRLRLCLDAPELADLPWEYLYNPVLNRFLSLSVETPLVRYLDLPERIQPLAVKPPLRVLVMISSPRDYPQLDVEQEWAKLREAVADLERRGLVIMEPLEVATLAALQRQLRQGVYHVFHFIGHGVFDRRAQDGVLLLEDEEERGRSVSGQHLGMLLHDVRELRLVILNACEGARTSRNDPFAGTAQSLVQQGIPAVVAMQFEITDEAAVTLAYEFYGALADGYPVDAALAEARKAIFAQGNNVEWGKPVLYLRAPDGCIFDIEQMSDEERQQAETAVLYREAQTAMDQEDWTAAVEKLQTVLDLDPTYPEAVTRLNQARREQELAFLYARGRKHYEAERWPESLEYFGRVRDMGGDYKGVSTIIPAIEKMMADELGRDQPAEGVRRQPIRFWPLLLFLALCLPLAVAGVIVWLQKMPDITGLFAASSSTPAATSSPVQMLALTNTPVALAPTSTLTPTAAPSAPTLTPTPTGMLVTPATVEVTTASSPTPAVIVVTATPSPLLLTHTPTPTATPSYAELEQALLDRVYWRFGNGEPIFAYSADPPPILDGYLDPREWTSAEYTVDNAFRGYRPENWAGAADLSGRFYIAWDESYLYLGLEVYDDLHVQESSGSELWRGDAVEVFLDTDLSGDSSDAAWSADDSQVGLTVKDLQAGEYETYIWQPALLEEQRSFSLTLATRQTSGGGYILEMALPWSALNLSHPLNETPYGFCLALDDDDSPDNTADLESKFTTCPNHVYNDPTTWGTLILVDW